MGYIDNFSWVFDELLEASDEVMEDNCMFCVDEDIVDYSRYADERLFNPSEQDDLVLTPGLFCHDFILDNSSDKVQSFIYRNSNCGVSLRNDYVIVDSVNKDFMCTQVSVKSAKDFIDNSDLKNTELRRAFLKEIANLKNSTMSELSESGETISAYCLLKYYEISEDIEDELYLNNPKIKEDLSNLENLMSELSNETSAKESVKVEDLGNFVDILILKESGEYVKYARVPVEHINRIKELLNGKKDDDEDFSESSYF